MSRGDGNPPRCARDAARVHDRRRELGRKAGPGFDRLLDQDGTLKMGEYQSWSDIVDPIIRDTKPTASLPATSWMRRPRRRRSKACRSRWISRRSSSDGSAATKSTPGKSAARPKACLIRKTSEFQLSWDHLFDAKKHDDMGDKSRHLLFARESDGVAPAAVPLAASGLLFGTGLVVLGSWSWLKRRGQALATA